MVQSLDTNATIVNEYNSPSIMSWFHSFTGKSSSSFVREEVLKRIPRSITIQFITEFDAENNPIIFICSPNYEGLISEAKTYPEAIQNAQDAILTYFDVPRDCASLIEFDIEEVQQPSFDDDGRHSILVKEFKLKEFANA